MVHADTMRFPGEKILGVSCCQWCLAIVFLLNMVFSVHFNSNLLAVHDQPIGKVNFCLIFVFDSFHPSVTRAVQWHA